MVCTYNKGMGSLDLLDSLIGLYQIKICLKKYYYKIFYHFLNVTVVKSWLLYKRDCKGFCVPKCKQLPLLQCKHCIAESLFREGKSVIALKSGRPYSVDKNYQIKKAKSTNFEPIPDKSIRHDNTDHFPIYKEKSGRCVLPGCKSSPYLFCQKCKVYLCIDKNKNCLYNFHKY